MSGLDLTEEEEEALLRDDADDVMDTSEVGASASWYDRVPPPPPTARGPMTPPEWKRAARPAHAFTPSLLARGEEKGHGRRGRREGMGHGMNYAVVRGVS